MKKNIKTVALALLLTGSWSFDAVAMEKKTDINRQLLEAASVGNHKKVTQLLKDGADINTKNFVGWTALHIAVSWKRLEVIKTLCNYDEQNVDTKESWHECTPLHFAAQLNDSKAVEILIDNGANVDAKNRSGVTALSEAANRGNSEVVKTLIKNGASTDYPECTITPMHYAAYGDHSEVVKILFRNGFKISPKDHQKKTPLHRAAGNNHLETMKILVWFGANPHTEVYDLKPKNKKPFGELLEWHSKNKSKCGPHNRYRTHVLITKKEREESTKKRSEYFESVANLGNLSLLF